MEPLGREQVEAMTRFAKDGLYCSETASVDIVQLSETIAALRQRLEQSEHEKVEAQNACCDARLALPHDDEDGALADGITRLRQRLEEVQEDCRTLIQDRDLAFHQRDEYYKRLEDVERSNAQGESQYIEVCHELDRVNGELEACRGELNLARMEIAERLKDHSEMSIDYAEVRKRLATVEREAEEQGENLLSQICTYRDEIIPQLEHQLTTLQAKLQVVKTAFEQMQPCADGETDNTALLQLRLDLSALQGELAHAQFDKDHYEWVKQRLKEKEAELEGLAASQCEDPILDDHGHVWCGRIKELERQLAVSQANYQRDLTAAQADNTRLREALVRVYCSESPAYFAVAEVCDGWLDRSGKTLGEIRDAALKHKQAQRALSGEE